MALAVQDDGGDHVTIGDTCDYEKFGDGGGHAPRLIWAIWWWAKMAVMLILAGVLAAIFIFWVGPYIMNKHIIPIIIWERDTFSTPVLALILFATIAIFPVILLPSTPSMWVAGMSYGYGLGFLLIIGGAAIGVSLPYFIGSLFYHKIHGWLENYPKKASIIKLTGGGNWAGQFRDVTLIRISPFPYIIYNYCAVATDVKYGPYLLGSLVGMVPEIFIAIYTGILIRTLADASHDQNSLTGSEIIFNILGFCGTVFTTILVTIYAKGRLKKLHKDEPLLLQ